MGTFWFVKYFFARLLLRVNGAVIIGIFTGIVLWGILVAPFTPFFTQPIAQELSVAYIIGFVFVGLCLYLQTRLAKHFENVFDVSNVEGGGLASWRCDHVSYELMQMAVDEKMCALTDTLINVHTKADYIAAYEAFRRAQVMARSCGWKVHEPDHYIELAFELYHGSWSSR